MHFRQRLQVFLARHFTHGLDSQAVIVGVPRSKGCKAVTLESITEDRGRLSRRRNCVDTQGDLGNGRGGRFELFSELLRRASQEIGAGGCARAFAARGTAVATQNHEHRSYGRQYDGQSRPVNAQLFIRR